MESISSMNDPLLDQSSDSQVEHHGFTVSLGIAAHQQAEQFLVQHRRSPALAKQVYLNTLAVYAVNYYLHDCLEFETDISQSASQDPVMQVLANVADLYLTTIGRVECRVVLPGETAVRVPMEVWDDRVAYIAVQVNQELTEATLVGFLPAIAAEEVPLHQWQSMDNLLPHLTQQAAVAGWADGHATGQVTGQVTTPAELGPVTHLSQWLQNQVDAVWKALDDLLDVSQPAFSFRRSSNHHQEDAGIPGEGWVKRAKALELPDCPEPLALLVGIRQVHSQADRAVWIRVCPIDHQVSLPTNLTITLRNQDQETVGTLRATSPGDGLQFRFEAAPGEIFSLQVELAQSQVTELFQV
jgi:hypothetical protein